MQLTRAIALCALLVACGKRTPDVGERIGQQRLRVYDAIERGAIEEAEAELTELERISAGTDFADQSDVKNSLAELYFDEWHAGPQRSFAVLETVKTGNDCSTVGQVISTADVAKNRAHVLRARELYRASCDWWYASDLSASLGDIDGVEADVAAGHAAWQAHTCLTVGPNDDRDYTQVRMALGAGDLPRARRAAEQALAWVPDMGYSWPAVYACRTNLTLAWIAEQETKYSEALKLYAAIPPDPPETDDDCFWSAAARIAALKDAVDGRPLPATHVTASAIAPPGTHVRVAFIAQPPTPADRQPALFGNKPGGLRTFGPRRDQYFFVDAAVDDHGQLSADLPPGTWLAQIELEPAEDWRLDDTCWPLIIAAGKPISLGTFGFVHEEP